MHTIDLPTIYLSYIVVNIINLLLSTSLYLHIKKRFPGTFLIVLSMFLNTTGNILVFLRNIIPDWLSIPIANLLIVLSLVMLLIGLEKFVNKKGNQIYNYGVIFLFFILHNYFTYVTPNIEARHLNITFVFMYFCIQIAYLMLRRTPETMRNITSPLGYVFVFIGSIQVFRIIYLIQTIYPHSSSIEAVFVLSWQINIMLILYSLFLMYNKRLIIDVNTQEEKFSKAFHAAPFMIMLSKVDTGEIFEVNKRIQKICGHHPNELIGKKTKDLNVWKNPKDRSKFLSDLTSKGAVIEDEYEFRKKNGELFCGLISANIVNINNQECLISVINDITIRKKAELTLRKNKEILKTLNSTKDKFFSIIAHDLKSPFNGILGFSNILSEEVKNKNYKGIHEYAEIINTSSKHAVDLLTNLMEWSMSQTGRMVFSPEYVDIIPMIHETMALLKSSSDQKLIHISLDLPPVMILYIDRTMIDVVLRNIISNAIKFTPQNGSIHFSIKELKDDYLFTVTDSGIGIKEHNIDKLFRIDDSYSTLGTNNERGTGLGLILCKEFIDYHQGKIWVESEYNSGSQFYFSLPKDQY